MGVRLAWIVVGLIESFETVLLSRRAPTAGIVLRTIGREVAPWLVWTMATPMVLRLVRRTPFALGGRARAIAAHLAAAALLLAAHASAYYAGMAIFDPASVAQATAGPSGVATMLVGWLPTVAVAYGGLVAAAYSIEYARRESERALAQSALSEQLVRAELSALRMQLNPHFLFNALNTVAGLVRDCHPDQAVELIAELGQVLRSVLLGAGAHAQTVPLEDEVAFTRRYIGIEQVRFQDRLRVVWNLDPALATTPVPSFVLQPLVENSLRHGIAKRTEPGTITIGATREAESLVLRVADDGPDTPGPSAGPGATSGVGLANVRARLSRLYGPGATVTVSTAPTGGTAVTVRIPPAPDRVP